MLNQFRLRSQTFGRTLLGMLLFVWLSMAVSPCVMANNMMASNGFEAVDVATIEAVHANMDECNYCPDNSMNTELCQNVHSITSDSLVLAIDSIDTESFLLFEIPATLSVSQLNVITHPSQLSKNSEKKTIPPLALTGILRI
ncbi:MAG: hypothetical protein OQL19_22505 [Gammaproteobacteria bacterium]|nr:hypothetical protein [Gammaproteobacteria bacterium]